MPLLLSHLILYAGADLDRMSTSDAMDAMLDDLANLGTSAAQQRKRDSTGDAIESLLGDLGGAEAVANNKTPAASVRLGSAKPMCVCVFVCLSVCRLAMCPCCHHVLESP